MISVSSGGFFRKTAGRRPASGRPAGAGSFRACISGAGPWAGEERSGFMSGKKDVLYDA